MKTTIASVCATLLLAAICLNADEPAKTGLPAANPGGRVRTGTREEGCFANMREYLDAWDRTEQEPDPCFLPQDAADQPQPDNVTRSYNGEKF